MRGRRRLHTGEVVRHACRDGIRAQRPHGRGACGERPTRPGAGRVHALPRTAMRILHPWNDDHRPRPARPQPRPRRGDHQGGDLRPDLPVHRIHHDRALHPVGRTQRNTGGNLMTTIENRPPSPEDTADNDQKPCGHGRMLRKEDPRFIRGRGNYVDDVALPGMLHRATLGSPYAHDRIVSIDVTAALAHPKVKAGVTGADLAEKGLAWMPTLSNDVQAVLATDKVRFQGQEVAFVVAEDRYAARDALELIDVEYEALPPVVDVRTALAPDAPVIRTDLAGKTDNLCFEWETGDAAATEAVLAAADVVVMQDMVYPRVHPAPLETCGAIADYDDTDEKLTMWSTTQAPHLHRTLYAMFAGLPEHKIRVVSPDIGGGFGSKAPIYPGYVCAIVRAPGTGRPVKWMEDRSENLMSTAFARDYHMHGEIAATRDGKVLGLRVKVLADHGAFNGAAQPTKFPAGFFGVFTGSYDLEAAHCEVTAVYPNKAPGGGG